MSPKQNFESRKGHSKTYSGDKIRFIWKASMAVRTCLKFSSKRHNSKPRGCSRILWKKFVKRRLSTSISSSDAGLKVIIWAFSCVPPSPIWYSFSKLFSVGASPFGLPLAWACFVAAWSFKRWPRNPFVVHVVICGAGFHRLGYRSALLPFRTW